MRILTWNCNGALRKKFQHIAELSAAIHIIQECENPEDCRDKSYQAWAANYLWIGDNKNKGLGIFAGNNIKLDKLPWRSAGLSYFIPCRVNGKFNLVGAWCHGAQAPTFNYIGQFWKYLQLHKQKLEDCLLAGDFNSNVIWDKKRRTWNHSDVVRELRKLDIESLYHLQRREEQGKETTPTFYLQRNRDKSYHLDYIFASASVSGHLREFTIGLPTRWLQLSDHMPVICDVDLIG